MEPRLIIDNRLFEITITRLCYQLIENHGDFSGSAIIGIQPRGITLSHRIHQKLTEILGGKTILIGDLDVTFFRDDFRRRDTPIIPSTTQIDFLVENKQVILVDDVLFTGRTIRAAMDAVLSYGRPSKVELLTLIDRRYTRHLPIEPNYVGLSVDTMSSENVRVKWKETDGEDQVWLLTTEKK